jgi:hypothetical protein
MYEMPANNEMSLSVILLNKFNLLYAILAVFDIFALFIKSAIIFPDASYSMTLFASDKFVIN